MKSKAITLYPFVPSGPDFQLSLAFFAELGFARLWEDDGFAGLRFGGAYFMLQNVDLPEWQKHQMVTFEVDDLDLYWSEIAALQLAARYRGVSIRSPTEFPWGREIHIIDPGGVCWHVRQAKRS
jgi:hypothetical protein